MPRRAAQGRRMTHGRLGRMQTRWPRGAQYSSHDKKPPRRPFGLPRGFAVLRFWYGARCFLAGTGGCGGVRLFFFPSMSRHAVPARRSSVAGTFLSAGRGYAAPCAAAAFAADDYFYFRPCTGTQRPPGAAPWRAPFFRPGEGMPRPVWLQLLRRVTISISICV